jgi:hypothetical protein
MLWSFKLHWFHTYTTTQTTHSQASWACWNWLSHKNPTPKCPPSSGRDDHWYHSKLYALLSCTTISLWRLVTAIVLQFKASHWQTAHVMQRHMNTRRKRWTDMWHLNQMNLQVLFQDTQRSAEENHRKWNGNHLLGDDVQTADIMAPSTIIDNILTSESPDRRLGSASGIDVICNVFQSSLHQFRYLERSRGTNDSRISSYHPVRNSLSNKATHLCRSCGPNCDLVPTTKSLDRLSKFETRNCTTNSPACLW